MAHKTISQCITAGLLLLLLALTAGAARLKEISEFRGAEELDLLGYGIVVGLDGTGDGSKSQFTMQALANMLERFGLSVDPAQLKPKNVAAVMVTAKLPAFARAGEHLDLTLSSMGDAKSLMGGTLLMTPLTDAEGQIAWANGQGPISIGGFNFEAGGSSIRKNYTLVGRVPEGGIVLRDRLGGLTRNGELTISLRDQDFTNARRVQDAVNTAFGEELAAALNGSQIRVTLPAGVLAEQQVVEMVSVIENLEIDVDLRARVVINERTGTVVVGRNVRLSPVAVAHGNLSVVIKSDQQSSQPAPFSLGNTAQNTNQDISVTADEARLVVLDDMIDVNGVARALNSLGVSPRDIISIFQLLKAAGALQADLVIV
ncbi:MAG: flagellar basal body P-ring protein FlgI [Calditrichaeota bacterium]|nr:flagellar basal body P-ring protein FlgI [Candidatus Cloacimonadota bacterium]MCB1047333.1 flagellar basal body P-ring protein FlgI [Calditrichota bacterium]MCB9474017.1 flagellar basal body P-ring protein FlgI [Candidatus Delongbacteria bacterium]